MTRRSSPLSISEFVSASAIRVGINLSVVLTLVLSIASIFLYTKFTTEKMNSSVRSIEKSITQSVALGDIYEVTKQIDSFIESGSVSGMWLFRADDREILKYKSTLIGFTPDPGHFKRYELIGFQLIVSEQKKIFSSGGLQLATLITSVSIPLKNYLVVALIICLILIASFYFVAGKFKSLGRNISGPIQEFSNRILARRSLDERIETPREFPYLELLQLYESHASMANKLSEMQKMEKEATIGRIISQLSHDLRAPLLVFERLLHLPGDTSILSQRDQIRGSLHRMQAMIESLRRADLELMIRPKHCRIDFSRCLDGLMSTAQHKGISLDLPPPLYPVQIDALKFERSLMNLVSNALDAARSEVRVETAVSGCELLVRVMDDGSGVPEAIVNNLFGRGVTSGKPGGTGLGLAYVRQIMQGHGGDVCYRREKGFSVFECRLPGAYVMKPGEIVENSLTLGFRLEQRIIQKVAIVLKPKTLSASILAKLASQKSEDFSFSDQVVDANIVVSNIDAVMFEVTEDDDKEFIHVAPSWGDEAEILSRLSRKFNVD